MQIVTDTSALPCIELKPEHIRATASPLAGKILTLLAEQPLHASDIAQRLGEHEQKIYYHVRRLREAGLLVIDHMEERGGGIAKVLRLEAPAYCVRFTELEQTTKQPAYASYLEPFIRNGRWNAKLVVGSPDPHGPEGARSRDASYALDLALFLGSFLEVPAAPAVVLDTELQNWKENLIIIGGPVVNKAAEKVNDHAPAWYDQHMFVTKKRGYPSENTGIIVKMPNPFAEGKYVLWVAGKRYRGTRAAILAFVKRFDELCTKHVHVVEGLDRDSDGSIDDVQFIE